MSALVTANLPGNIHDAAAHCNQLGLAKFVLTIQFNTGPRPTGLFYAEKYVDYMRIRNALGLPKRGELTEEEFYAD